MEYSYRIQAGGFQKPRLGRMEAIDVWDALYKIRALEMPLRIKHADIALGWPYWDDEHGRFDITQRCFSLFMLDGMEYWKELH